MIAIIDYGSGNVGAVANIYRQLRIPHAITRDLREVAQADRYILPGVGAFDPTMRHLRETGLVDLLNEQVIGNGKKAMGICVGMQILADSSDEGEELGLGWVPGRVRRIDQAALSAPPGLPHMGWNSIDSQVVSPMFKAVDMARGFYFLHSYYFDARTPDDVTATVAYGREMPCAVQRGNVYGMQFHPEKSHANGMAIFKNFAAI